MAREGDNRIGELLEEVKQILLEPGGDDDDEGVVSSKKFDLFPHTMADMFEIDCSAIDSIRLLSPYISHTAIYIPNPCV